MRYLICSFSFVLLPFLCFSQMEFGIKLGPNLSSASNFEIGLDPSETIVLNDVNRLGAQYGIWWDAPVGLDRMFLRSELLYIQKSWDMGDESGNATEPYTQLHYLSLPVTVQYQLSNFRIGAGPELSFLVDQSIRIDGTNLGDNLLIDEKKLELGANFDLQYNWNRWQFSLRYSLDLTPFLELTLTDVNGEPLANGTLIKNRALQLSAGYAIGYRGPQQ